MVTPLPPKDIGLNVDEFVKPKVVVKLVELGDELLDELSVELVVDVVEVVDDVVDVLDVVVDAEWLTGAVYMQE